MKSNYDFPVEFRSIVTEPGNLAIPNRQAVVRADTKMPLGVVSKKYALVPHKEVIRTFRTALEGNELQESVKVTHYGSRMHYEVVLPNVKVKITKDDEVAMRLIIENSYDGSHRLQIIFGAIRFACTNGMVIGRKFVSINRRHIGQVMLEVETVKPQIAMLTDLFHKEGETMRRMNETKLVPSPDEFFNPKKIHIPAYLTKLAHEAYGDGETVWDAYNALTAVITRGMKKDSPESQIALGKRAWTAATVLLK